MDKIFEWFLPIKKDDGMVLRGIRVGETAPKVRMHLIDDSGKGADITGVDAVSVIVERSDGMKVALTLSTQAVLCFSPAVVELSFEDARLSAVAGLCTGVIDFYSGDVRMTSARFRYNVEPGIDVSDDDIAQDPEYSMFVGAMTDLAMLNKEVSEAESARNVFEEYNPEKEYVKGNKVAYAGSSYVLVAESAIGTSPTDTESWLCIAEKGDKGEQGQQGIKGEKGDKGDKGVTGGKIFSYALGYGKDVEVGSYKMAIPPFELIENGIDYNDIIVDTDGGCIFQYVASIGDDEAMLPAEGLHCIANPNGEKGDKGDKGDKGEQGIPGNDAVLPNGIMKYIGSVNKLPVSASTGDVYKISETIFEGNTIVVPNDDGFHDAFNESNGAESMAIYNDSALYYAFMSAWEYVTATGNPLITVKVDGKPHDIEMVDFKESMGEEADQVFKYCGLAVYRQADEGTKLWYSFFGEWERAEFFIPEDYWQSVDEYRKVLFAKGECVVFKDGTWQRLSGDEAERVGLELKASNTISERERNRIWDGFEYSAYVDLSNVSNEDFKTKAEEAGVGGGTSGAMVFKGVVSELPDTANEGEAYKITNTTTSNLYVRHNGEWVEISKDGVTKAEMESYIEETLLGGKW